MIITKNTLGSVVPLLHKQNKTIVQTEKIPPAELNRASPLNQSKEQAGVTTTSPSYAEHRESGKKKAVQG